MLRFLDVDATTGKFIVNGLHQVQLPDGGGVTALGASLVVIYRDPTAPLNAIVMYDGAYTMDQSTESMVQHLQGFYQPATTKGKLTQIVGTPSQTNRSGCCSTACPSPPAHSARRKGRPGTIRRST